MKPVLTVTLSAMLDRTLWCGRIRPGHAHRAQRVLEVAGGKGINVARQLTRLGLPCLATGWVGGYTGARIQELLDREQVPHAFVNCAAPTRIGFTLREDCGRETACFEPNGFISSTERDALIHRVTDLLPTCSFLVCSGSSPSAEHDDVFEKLIIQARQAGVPVMLDTYGRALQLALSAGPDWIKPNLEELMQWNADLSQPNSARHAHPDLPSTAPRPEQRLRLIRKILAQTRSLQGVLSSAGADEAWWVTRDEWHRFSPPRISHPKPVGSGDAMVAGWIYGISQGWGSLESFRFAMACGAANATRDDVANSSFDEIRDQLDSIHPTLSSNGLD